MLKYIAHSDEAHVSSTESLMHLLKIWYSAVPIYITATLLIAYMIFYVSKKSLPATFITTSAWLLVSGILLYDLSPVASTIGIVSGLLLSSFMFMSGLIKK